MGIVEIALIGFAIYVGIMILLSERAMKWIASSSDYLVAGREISPWVNWFAVSAIGYAGTAITFGPMFSILFGFWGNVAWAVMYSIGGVFLYGLIFAPTLRRSGAHTLQEYFESRFDAKTRAVLSVSFLLAMFGIVANNMLSFAMTLQGFSGWSFYLCVSIGFLVVLTYTYLAGIWGVSIADFIETLVAIVIIPVMCIWLFATYGGWDFVTSNWPWGDPLVSGLRGSLPTWSLIYPSFLTAGLLYSIGLVWGSQHYFIRVASTRSEKAAKLSFMAAGITLFIMDGILLAFPGFYMIATQGPGILSAVKPEAAFGYMAKLYPPILTLVTMITALSAAMSTGGDCLIAAVSSALRDFYQRWVKPKATPKELLKPSRIFTLLLGIICWVLTLYPGGVMFLFAFGTSWLCPAAIILILGFVSRRITNAGAFWGSLCGLVAGTIWTLSQFIPGVPNLVATVAHIGVISTISTLIPTLLISAFTRPKYYAQSESPTKYRTEHKLSEEETRILDWIRRGYNHMWEIVDLAKTDLSKINPIVEKLDMEGYIEREGKYGTKFYAFHITEKGKKALGPLSPEEEKLASDMIRPIDLKILEYMETHERVIAEQLTKHTQQDVLECSISISHLIRLGYLKEVGILRRRVTITDKGKEILERHRTILQKI